MVVVDLDGDDFTFRADGSDLVRAHVQEWASPSQMHKDIAPRPKKFLEVPSKVKPGEVPKIKDYGWERLHNEIFLISTKVNEPWFARAADLLKLRSAEIVLKVAAAQKKSEADKGVKSPERQRYERVQFRLDGTALQDHEAYRRYRAQTYDKARGGVQMYDALGVLHNVLVTSPKALRSGAKLGSNIAPRDQDATSWGYPQNARMWLSDEDYVAAVTAFEDGTVPRYSFHTGEGASKEGIDMAVVGQETDEFPWSTVLPAILWGSDEASPEDSDEAIPTWLPKKMRALWHSAAAGQMISEAGQMISEPSAAVRQLDQEPLANLEPLANQEHLDLRLLLAYPESNVRFRFVTYEPFSASTFVSSYCRFHKHYKYYTKRISIPSLIACQFPIKSKRQAVPRREALRWMQRLVRGGSATLEEATRALGRYLIELRTGDDDYRKICQFRIMEDYYMAATSQGNPDFLALGEFVSACADIVFRSGQKSCLNKGGKRSPGDDDLPGEDDASSGGKKRKNGYAYERKDAFVAQFLPAMTVCPVRALDALSTKVNIYISAIPAIHAGTRGCLRAEFSTLLAAVPLPAQPNPHERILVWKGFAADQERRKQERLVRIAEAKSEKAKAEKVAAAAEVVLPAQ